MITVFFDAQLCQKCLSFLLKKTTREDTCAEMIKLEIVMGFTKKIKT